MWRHIIDFFNAGKVNYYDANHTENNHEEDNEENLPIDPSGNTYLPNGPLIDTPSMSGPLSPFTAPSYRSHPPMDMNSIRSLLTWYYQLKDQKLREEYYEFLDQKKSLWFLLFSNLFFTLVLFPFSITTLAFSADIMTSAQLASSVLSICFVTIGIILGWVVYTRNKYSFMVFPQLSNKSRQLLISVFQHGYIGVMQLYLINLFIRRSLIPLCERDETGFRNTFSSEHTCADMDIRIASLMGNGLLMLSIPLLYFSNLPETRIEFTWITFIFSYIAFLLVCIQLESVSSILIVGVWQFACVLAVADAQLRNFLLFFTNRQLKETLIENERMADELHANELRHMIGNVAHDLKTPLSSFTTGVELIQHLVDEYLQGHKVTGKIAELMDSVKSCLSNIRNTNSFMLMTINRCIDYTKASRGLKLVPKNETFELMETLELPLSCMQNIQNRIQIQLLPLPKLLCTHVISDRQWLQENILCLLSNAVKYSTSGAVTITVSLQMAPQRYSSVYSSAEDLSLHSKTTYQDDTKSHRIYPILESQVSKMTEFSARNSQENSARRANISRAISNVSFNQPQHILFEIEDTGIGIPEEAMKTLFNPFKQTQRLAGGTGLGLYSLAKRVEALRGVYGVKQRKDGQQGSLFWFTIPYRPDEVTSSLAKDLRKNSRSSMDMLINSTKLAELIHQKLNVAKDTIVHTESEESTKSKTDNSLSIVLEEKKKISMQVLIVDDSPAILKMTSMMLKKLGHNIEVAENGEVAVRMVADRWKSNKEKFDIILMDLQMPIMDGLEATKRIREFQKIESPHYSYMQFTEPLPKQIIIGMSANSDHETTEAAFGVGVSAFMGKPFNLASFSETLEYLLSTGEFSSTAFATSDLVESFKISQNH